MQMDLGLVFARMAGVSLKLEFNREIVIQAIHLVQEEAEDKVLAADRRAQSDCILVKSFLDNGYMWLRNYTLAKLLEAMSLALIIPQLLRRTIWHRERKHRSHSIRLFF